MIGWILFGITAVIAVVALAALKRKSDQELQRLEEARRASLQELETESEKRVKRLRREADSQKGKARDALARDLFASVDSLHSAIEGAADAETRTGIELVLHDIYHAFELHGIVPIEPDVGEPFDPNLHEAIEVDEEADVGRGEIARCHRIGFRDEGRVLRPAMVSVGSRVTAGVDELASGETEETQSGEEEAAHTVEAVRN